MPSPASATVRGLHGFIQGTPQTGWYELLDSSECLISIISLHRLSLLGYRMRTGYEARSFFVVGRVMSSFLTFVCSDSFF